MLLILAGILVAVSAVIIALVAGLVLIYRFYKKMRLYKQLAATDAVSPSDVSEGIVGVEGTVKEPVDKPVERTMRTWDTPVATAWKVREMKNGERRNHWNRKAQGIRTVPFVLETDGGDTTVTVNFGNANSETGATDERNSGLPRFDWPSGADSVTNKNDVHVGSLLFAADDSRYFSEVEPETSPPEGVASVLDQFDTVDTVTDSKFFSFLRFGKKDRTRRYIEDAIEAGDTVYIYGTAVNEDRDGWESGVTIEPPEDGYAVISTFSKDALEQRVKDSQELLKKAGSIIILLLLFFYILFAVL